MTTIIRLVLAVMTVREGGMISLRGESNQHRFIGMEGSENVKDHSLSDGGQISVVRTAIPV